MHIYEAYMNEKIDFNPRHGIKFSCIAEFIRRIDALYSKIHKFRGG